MTGPSAGPWPWHQWDMVEGHFWRDKAWHKKVSIISHNFIGISNSPDDFRRSELGLWSRSSPPGDGLPGDA